MLDLSIKSEVRMTECSGFLTRWVKKLRRTQNAVKQGIYGTPESRISAA